MSICEKCGTEFETEKCPNCETVVSVEEVTPPAAEHTESQPAPKKKKGMTIGIAVAVIAIIVAVVLVLVLGGSSGAPPSPLVMSYFVPHRSI